MKTKRFTNKAHGSESTIHKILMLLVAVGIIVILTACSSPTTTKSSIATSSTAPAATTSQSAATASQPAATTSKPPAPVQPPAPGKPPPPGQPTASGQPPAPVQPPAGTVTPKKGGVFSLAQNRAPSNFGYPPDMKGGNGFYAGPVLETLIYGDVKNPGQFLPLLAESWDLAPDKSSYTFHLKKGVKFHDGTDFNADVVQYNLGQYIGAKVPQFSRVKSLDIIDAYTIRFNLSAWDRTVLNDFSAQTAFIISPTAAKAKGKDWCYINPVGTGPFKIKSYVPQQSLEYQRFEGYWNTGLPYLDGIKMFFVADFMTGSAMIQKGTIDNFRAADYIALQDVKTTKKDWIVYGTAPITNGLAFNSIRADSVFSDVRVRQAFEYAIDKKKISDALWGGLAQPYYQVLNDVDKMGANPGTTPRTYNPAKARELLAAAKFPTNLKIKLVETTNTNQNMWTAIQAMLNDVGVQVELSPIQITSWSSLTMSDLPPNELWWAQVQGRGAGTGTFSVIKNSWTKNAIYYYGTKRPEGLYELTDAVLLTEDPAKTKDLLGKIENLLYNDATIINLVDDTLFDIYHPDSKLVNAEGLSPATAGGRAPWEYIWKDK